MQIKDLNKLEKDLKKLMDKELPIILSNEAVNFYRFSFRRKGFVDKKFEHWKKTKKETGSTLIKTHHLQNSIRVAKRASSGFLVVAGNQKVPYAKIHNEGRKIRITKKSHKFFWYIFRKTNNPIRK
jgi:phage gpG-like protein